MTTDTGPTVDLFVGVLTVVPLILITSAIDAGILRRASETIKRYRAGQGGWNHLKWWYIVVFDAIWGFGMCLAAVGAMILSVIALGQRTDAFNGWIVGCTLSVIVGIGLAFGFSIWRALFRESHPVRADDVAPRSDVRVSSME
jgi:hypothetical protein